MPERSSSKNLLYAYRHGLSFGFFEGIVWLIASATPMILLLQHLGGSPFQVGLAYSFGYLILPLQVLATAFLRHFGYKKQLLFSWSTRTLFLFIPLTLALLSPNSPQSWMPTLMVWAFFFFSLFRAFGHSAWFPWLYSLVPDKFHGRYFAFDQSLMNLAGVLVLLLSAGFFFVFTTYNAFALVYLITIFASLAAIYSIKKLPTVKNLETSNLKDIWKNSLRLCRTPGPFRFYLIISLLWFLVGTPYIPFTIFYLNESLNVPDGTIIFYTGIQYFGSILTAFLIRRSLDRLGVKPFFVIALVISILVKIYWIFLVLDFPFLLNGISIIFLVSGIGTVLWQMAHLKYIPQLCTPKDRALGVALQTAVVGFAGGIAPILCGFLLSSGPSHLSISSPAFILYFIIAIFVLSILIIPFSQVKEIHPDVPPLFSPSSLARPFRFITKLYLFRRQK